MSRTTCPLASLALFASASSLGCGASTDDDLLLEGTELFDHQAWETTSPEDDPWSEHRPRDVDCRGGWYVEDDTIEVDTEVCAYLTASQPLRMRIPRDTTVRLSLWWQTLASVAPAQGHIGLAVGDDVVWEEWIDIPGPADARDVEWDIPQDWPQGAPMTFHVHNHGFNTWKLASLSVLAPEENEP